MKRISDNFLTMLLPLTVVAATAFSLVAAVAFRMGATTAGFVFATLSIVGWIGLFAEFFLLYDIIIYKWLSKDRSVLTASWFVISLLLAFILTPDKHTDWSTCIIMASLFAVVFLLPCIIRTILFLVPVTVTRWRDFLCPSENRPVSFRAYKLPCTDYQGLWRVYSSLILRFCSIYSCIYNPQCSLFVSFIVIVSG